FTVTSGGHTSTDGTETGNSVRGAYNSTQTTNSSQTRHERTENHTDVTTSSTTTTTTGATNTVAGNNLSGQSRPAVTDTLHTTDAGTHPTLALSAVNSSDVSTERTTTTTANTVTGDTVTDEHAVATGDSSETTTNAGVDIETTDKHTTE